MTESTILSDGTMLIIYIWKKVLNTFLNVFLFDDGVAVGWVIIAVNLIVIMIATILSRPISRTVEWSKKEE